MIRAVLIIESPWGYFETATTFRSAETLRVRKEVVIPVPYQFLSNTRRLQYHRHRKV